MKWGKKEKSCSNRREALDQIIQQFLKKTNKSCDWVRRWSCLLDHQTAFTFHNARPRKTNSCLSLSPRWCNPALFLIPHFFVLKNSSRFIWSSFFFFFHSTPPPCLTYSLYIHRKKEWEDIRWLSAWSVIHGDRLSSLRGCGSFLILSLFPPFSCSLFLESFLFLFFLSCRRRRVHHTHTHTKKRGEKHKQNDIHNERQGGGLISCRIITIPLLFHFSLFMRLHLGKERLHFFFSFLSECNKHVV